MVVPGNGKSMLTELRIQNFAIIDKLDLKPGAGLIILTGETGAGKSIILDAVEMLVGGRADATVIRTDADAALVEGVFHLAGPEKEAVNAVLQREDLLDDPDYVTLSREVRREGRNVARLNGRTVGVSLLEGDRRLPGRYPRAVRAPVAARPARTLGLAGSLCRYRRPARAITASRIRNWPACAAS